jgi:hypothetical protein
MTPTPKTHTPQGIDPSTPAWLLDVAEDVTAYRNDPAAIAKMAAHGAEDHDMRFRSAALYDAMRERGEDVWQDDVWNGTLWQLRWSQLASLLAAKDGDPR